MSKIPIEETKFYCVRPDKIYDIRQSYKGDSVLEYIEELWNLIEYINKRNENDRQSLIAFKHKHAWKEYDKDAALYNPETRTYSKPPKTGENYSC